MQTVYCYLLAFACLLLIPQTADTQVNYTANDRVVPYKGYFGYGTNVGYYPQWTQEQLADITIGNKAEDVDGVGITTMRPALFEHFMEQWGYDLRVKTFEHYKKLGAKDNVVFVGYPSDKHRDPKEYCSGTRSELFRNLYTPIWDNGANGTPYNDNNYYAAYLHKTVTLYKDYVKFWEIWNEPDYSFTANSIERPGEDGNWWENNPDPCDYDIHAPIFHYIRMLRISYDIIKTVDPEAYVAIGGIGYPSFLDAVLRNTDNPNNGQVSDDYPLMGGAYFDVLSYHTYPHIDNSLRKWNNDIKGFEYSRHTDAAVKGVLNLRNRFEEVLFNHGYDGAEYPEKEWIITESNVPRKPVNRGFGSEEVQRNFIIKALVESQKYDIHQFHIFTLGDKIDYARAKDVYDEYHIMGLFKNMYSAKPYKQKNNDVGTTYATTSEILYGKRFDHEAFDRLKLPKGVNGGVFKDEKTEKLTYVFWAETEIDRSESVMQVVNFKELLGIDQFIQKEWSYSFTKDTTLVNGNAVTLTGEPVFLEEVEDGKDDPSDDGDGPDKPGKPYVVDVFPNPFLIDVNISLNLKKDDQVTMMILDYIGRPIKILANNERMEAGSYTWSFDGNAFRKGIYFLKYRTSESAKYERILLVKNKK
ncbi:MAG: T9SS type A sorting domain-containing protein [Bacteroidota bacterium]